MPDIRNLGTEKTSLASTDGVPLQESGGTTRWSQVANLVSYSTLNTNGDVGSGATQVAQGDHNHDADYISVVSTPTTGNFPQLTAGGELVNSAYDETSFALDGHNHDADYISIVGTPTTGNFPQLTAGGELVNSAYDETSFSLSGHDHAGTYEPADATILKEADVDDIPVDAATTAPISSNWAYDHENAADPHTVYPLDTEVLKKDGSVALTANWDVGAFTITALRFISDQTTGTAPLTVASTTAVTNLNADQVDGKDAQELGSLTRVAKTASFSAQKSDGQTALYDITSGTVTVTVQTLASGGYTIGDSFLVTAATASTVTFGTSGLTVNLPTGKVLGLFGDDSTIAITYVGSATILVTGDLEDA